MIHNDAAWQPLPLGALIVSLIIVGICIAVSVAAQVFSDEPMLTHICTGMVVFMVVLIGGLLLFPWKWDYLSYRTVDGTVAKVDGRLMSNGDAGSTQVYVITYSTGLVAKCDDGRCGQLKQGDYLALACSKEFQFVGTPGWSCSYLDSRSKA